VRIEEASHGLRIHQRFHRARWDAAVMVVGPVEADDHVALRFIKTDAPNKTAAGHICAGERRKIERTSVLMSTVSERAGDAHSTSIGIIVLISRWQRMAHPLSGACARALLRL
jgi:hypothetical protein